MRACNYSELYLTKEVFQSRRPCIPGCKLNRFRVLRGRSPSASEFRNCFQMTALGRKLLVNAAKLYDLAVMSLSFGLAAVLVAHQTTTVSFADFLAVRIKVRNFLLFACFLFVWN